MNNRYDDLPKGFKTEDPVFNGQSLQFDSPVNETTPTVAPTNQSSDPLNGRNSKQTYPVNSYVYSMDIPTSKKRQKVTRKTKIILLSIAAVLVLVAVVIAAVAITVVCLTQSNSNTPSTSISGGNSSSVSTPSVTIPAPTPSVTVPAPVIGFCVRSAEVKITDSGRAHQHMDVVYLSEKMDVKALAAAGYSTLKVKITLEVKELDDGYQWIFLYSNSICDKSDSSLLYAMQFEHGSGKKDTSWGSHSFEFNIPMKDLTRDLYIRYGASGNFDDDWQNRNVYISYEVIR